MSILAGIIEREIDLVSRFIAALNEEQDCLKQAEPAPLPGLGVTKAELVEQMNALENERMAAIGEAGKPSGRASMENWLTNNPSDTAAALNWKKLLDLAREAKSLHELNGSLVEMHLKNTAEALVILTQQANRTSLYGSSGQAMPDTGSRIVDSA
ncbi:MAG: FlgN [Proteobacteria bacterium]|nr:FlgN [Pseudomonadota bacterium]